MPRRQLSSAFAWNATSRHGLLASWGLIGCDGQIDRRNSRPSGRLESTLIVKSLMALYCLLCCGKVLSQSVVKSPVQDLASWAVEASFDCAELEVAIVFTSGNMIGPMLVGSGLTTSL